MKIAIIGSGISGMSAAWLLSKNHDVTVYEKKDYVGGHTNTRIVSVPEGEIPVDTGFIVFNDATYPNLIALFEHLGVETHKSDMSFAVSLDGGRLEYSGSGIGGLFAQQSNVFRWRFWMMLRDLLRFYRETPAHAGKLGLMALGEYLERERYGRAFRDDHLLPMAAAIWSAPANTLLDYPAESFIRFCENHGLLKLANRPAWRTVKGGSKSYVGKLTSAYADRINTARAATSVRRAAGQAFVRDETGTETAFDHVVMACHANETLHLLADASAEERNLLSPFRYSLNSTVLHEDDRLMPNRRAVWSSWNYLGKRDEGQLCVTYWMNKLQELGTKRDIFVTLNPTVEIDPAKVHYSTQYEHPIFDREALQAQRSLWDLQGQNATWFCGAYFGAGFHEDGLQSGLAVAEDLGGERRPWNVEDESSRIVRKSQNIVLRAAA